MHISERLEINLKNNENLVKNDPLLRYEILYLYKYLRYNFINYYIYFFRESLFDERTGRVKKAGEIYYLPKLAETLQVIVKEGADAMYNGSLTFKLLEDIRNANGIITEEDLANYK